MTIKYQLTLLLSIIFSLSACGGGGGSSNDASTNDLPQPPPVDSTLDPLYDLILGSHMVDVDADGDLDIVIGIQNEKLEIASDLSLINDGNANFTILENAIPDHYLGKDGATISISSGDFNSDNFNDLITITVDGRPESSYETAQIHLYLGVGDGTFTDATSNIAGSFLTEWVGITRIGDFNLDGHLDFVTASPGLAAQHIYLNDGLANFSVAIITSTDAERTYTSDRLLWESDGNIQEWQGSNRYAADVLVGDVNNDGHLDLVAPAPSAGAMATFINTSTAGNLTFDIVYTVNSTDPFSASNPKQFKSGALLDLNGDGYLDIVGSTAISGQDEAEVPVYTYLNNGDGSFTQSADVIAGLEHARQWMVADFNQDGKDDLFVADHGYDAGLFPGEKNLLLINDGLGVLVDKTVESLTANSSYTHGASAGDLNGDGYPDLFLNHFSGDVDVRLWMNKKDGTFESKPFMQ